MRWGCLVATATMAFAVTVEAAWAQRASENVVNSAEDAFGVSVGNESIGLYSSSSARGFNPQQAGNLRLEGLYWDQQGSATGRLYGSSTMRVGLSAQSYPFPAPTGIVDTRLTRPTDHFSGSAGFNYGPYDSILVETEASGPLVAGKLGAYATFRFERPQLDAQSTYSAVSYAGLLRWTPSDRVDLMAFHQSLNGFEAEVAPVIFTAGGAIPPEYDRIVYFGQPWVLRGRHVRQMGVIMSATLFDDWLLRTGFFRSYLRLPVDYVTFYRNVGADGVGSVDVLKTPPLRDTAYSGEARLSRTITEGPRQHTLHIAIRGRKTDHLFGGGATVALGTAKIGVKDPRPEPTFVLAPGTVDHISQVTPGFSYVGRWRDVGELSFGAQKSFYDREINPPTTPATRTTSEPWLYNGTLAVYLGKNTALYGSYTRGLEESGIAPEAAINRGEAMPASLTQQVDAGIRYRIGAGTTLIAGVFEVKKPFFDRNAANVFADVGNLSHQGIELSISGRLAPGLTVVAGAMLLRARVEADAAVASFIAPVPVGRPNRNVRLNVQYGPASWRGFSVDGQVSQDGPAYANRANTVRIGANTTFDLGARYVFKVFGTSASARARVQNLTDEYGWTVSSSGAYAASPARRFTVQLVTDF